MIAFMFQFPSCTPVVYTIRPRYTYACLSVYTSVSVYVSVSASVFFDYAGLSFRLLCIWYYAYSHAHVVYFICYVYAYAYALCVFFMFCLFLLCGYDTLFFGV